MINIQEAAVVGKCNEVLSVQVFHPYLLSGFWCVQTECSRRYHTDRSAPSILVPYRKGRIRTKSTEAEFEPLITFWVSCDRPFMPFIVQARRSKKWTTEVEEEGEGDARKHWTAFVFLRIKSCGFRRDSGQPAFLSISKNFLCVFFCGRACYYNFFAKENSFVRVLGSGVKPQKPLKLGKKLF